MGDRDTTQQQAESRQAGASEEPTDQRAVVSPPELSRAVISVLGHAEKPLSIRQIEHGVGDVLNYVGSAPVEGEVSALEQLGVVERGADNKLFSLSAQGRELATGIEILSRA